MVTSAGHLVVEVLAVAVAPVDQVGEQVAHGILRVGPGGVPEAGEAAPAQAARRAFI